MGKFFEGLTTKTFVVGIQHVFVMMGATVLVPILTGLPVSVALFAAGIGTIIFHVATKFQMPVFLGSSFAFIPVIASIAAMEGGSLAQALGGIFVAGAVYLLVSLILRFVGVDIMHKVFPAQVTGPIIILIGLLLAPVAVANAQTNWWIAMATLATGIAVKIIFEKKFLGALPILVALVAGYVLAFILGETDFSAVGQAAWLGLPEFMLPEFSLTAISIAVPVALVTIIEHFGDVLAIGNVTGKDFVKDPGVSRTLLGDGLATMVSAAIGGPANTTYSENTGAVALTGVKEPVVMRIAALTAIVLAFIPKFSAMIASVPLPVIGGISILLFGMISSIGIKNMVDAQVDLSLPKNLIVSATILVLGVGGAEVIIGLGESLGSVTFTGLGLAALVGILLNAAFNWRSFGKSAATEK